MSKLESYTHKYFFDQGLQFTCQRCGICCSQEPGLVTIELQEVHEISRYLNISSRHFISTYCDIHADKYRLKEHDDFRCIFFDEGCQIYPVRPNQCQTFPFWFMNLRSQKAWNTAQKSCPGIGKGKIYDKEEILKIAGKSRL